MLNYDGRTFSGRRQGALSRSAQPVTTKTTTSSRGEFAGGHVRRGSLAGTCSPDGILHFAYCMVYDSGEVVSGRCRSTPQLLDDGRIRLNEEWERYTPRADRGVSYLDETPA